MADPSFDPRFDPVFQPGFDPQKHAGGTQAAVDSGERMTPTAVTRTEPANAVETAVPPVAAAAAAGEGRRRNPLLIALWVASAVLVAAGIYGLRLIADRVSSLGTSGGFGEADYYLMQAYTVLAPLLITLGVATAVGTMFLLAARWRHR